MIKRFLASCTKHQLISPNDLIFVALSGGMDSVALFDLFLTAAKDLSLTVKAVHVNHGIRGSEADRDEHFVRSFCTQRNVDLRVFHLQGMSAQSTEATLRQARYRLFDDLLASFPQAKLATAHTLNDNIETLLMRLAKGSSLKGLRGIPLKRGAYIRPLLFFRRAEIEQYVRERHLPFVQDSSNASLKYLRNRIRHQIVPVFEEIFGSSFYDSLAKSIAEINEFYGLFEEEFMNRLPALLVESSDKLEIDLRKYETLHRLYRYRLIDYCISAFYPLNYSFSKTYLRQIDQFMRQAHSGAVLTVYEDVRLLKDRHKAVFLRQVRPQAETVLLDTETKVRFGAFEIEIQKIAPEEVRFTNDKNVEFICGDSLRFPLIVRRWQAGDRFYPLGMGKSQKVKEFFINQKIDVWSKNEIPLVCNGTSIVWIAGHRLDERYRVHENCKTVYRLTLKKIGN